MLPRLLQSARCRTRGAERGFPRGARRPLARALSDMRKWRRRFCAPLESTRGRVLRLLNILQVVLYVPLLALLGQALLFVLAGGKHQSNFFYQLLSKLASPFTWLVRTLAPKVLSVAQVGVITFMLLVVCSFVVFAERGYLYCVELGYADCRR